MLRRGAGIDHVAHRFGRRRRSDHGVEIRTRPAPRARTKRAETRVRRGTRSDCLRELIERREDFVGHLRRACIHDGDAVVADRCRDVRAIGHEHVDVPLHGQHVHLAVSWTLIRNPLRDVVRRARGRNGQRINLRRVHLQAAHRRAVFRIQRLDPAPRRLEREPVVLLQELPDRAVLTRKKMRHPMAIAAAVLSGR